MEASFDREAVRLPTTPAEAFGERSLADTIPQIEHAWLIDHLLPIGGDPNGPIFEGWTLLSALAVHTERLRLGLLVTSNHRHVNLIGVSRARQHRDSASVIT